MSKDETGSTESQGIPGFSANNSIPGGFTLPIPIATAGGSQPEETPADPWSSTWEDTSWQAADEQPSATDHPTDHSSGDSSTSTTSTTSSWGDWQSSESTETSYSGWTPAGATSDDATDESAGSSSSFATDHSRAERAYAARPAVDPDVAAAAREGYGTEPTAYDSGSRTNGSGSAGSDGPNAEDLITARSKGARQKVKSSSGLRKALGLGPSSREMQERDRIDRIARPLNGRKTVMVINTKGGGGKTLVTLMLASYLGRYRSGSVLAWDNNETEGTLGMRAPSQSHHRTVVDLLGALPTIANDPNAGTSELEHWVREQRGLSFDVLASADDDEAMRIIGEQEFEDLHTQLSRFYRMIVVDTGNNRLSPNWLAAAARADMLVFATSLKDDTSVVAAKNLDALVAMGRGDLVRNAVCVISHTSAKTDTVGAGVHTREHFEQWVRSVVDIPYDPMLAPGLHLDPLKIAKRTHEACMEMAATVVDGL